MNVDKERRQLIDRVRSALRREGLEGIDVDCDDTGQVILSIESARGITESERAVAFAIARTSKGVLKVRFESR